MSVKQMPLTSRARVLPYNSSKQTRKSPDAGYPEARRSMPCPPSEGISMCKDKRSMELPSVPLTESSRATVLFVSLLFPICGVY